MDTNKHVKGLRVRLTNSQYRKLQTTASELSMSMSAVLRSNINILKGTLTENVKNRDVK